MKKNVRLVSYLNLLYSNDYMSADEFATLININVRTVFRDIKTIENLGIEVFVEPRKGYYVRNGIPIQYLNFQNEKKKH